MSRPRLTLIVCISILSSLPSNLRAQADTPAPSTTLPSWLKEQAGPGAQLWTKRFSSPGDRADAALSIAVDPGGTKVFVAGYVNDPSGASDYATVSYDLSTGRQLWRAIYRGAGLGSAIQSVAVSPDGSSVYVTGQSYGATSSFDYVTIAYQAS